MNVVSKKMQMILIISVIFTVSLHAEGVPVSVSDQGYIRVADGKMFCSSSGTYRFQPEFAPVSLHCWNISGILYGPDDFSRRLPPYPANGMLLSDQGFVVYILTPETDIRPSEITITDFTGIIQYHVFVEGFTNPVFSSDGSMLLYRNSSNVVALNLITRAATTYPKYDAYAVSPDGDVAGSLMNEGSRIYLHRSGKPTAVLTVPEEPREMAFSYFGNCLFIMTRQALYEYDLDAGQTRLMYRPGTDFICRDISVRDPDILLGCRSVNDGIFQGRLLSLASDGSAMEIDHTSSNRVNIVFDRDAEDGIPWPFLPDEQHWVGNTYGAFQEFTPGYPYLHPGVDILSVPNEPVYAVRSGIVKAILTTSAEYHWRVAVADESGSGTGDGYLYAHLIQSTIAVDVGDTVEQGQYLGEIIGWPIADFNHIHFARIRDSGTVWYGNWLSCENPHLQITHQTETEIPVFYPALDTDPFAFCINNTDTYLDPSNLTDQVDIIACIADTVLLDFEVAVQEIRYTIFPELHPEIPVVDDKLAVYFNMPLDSYQGGYNDSLILPVIYKTDSTCQTYFGYYGAKYYHIITNNDGDYECTPSDADSAWDTTIIPDGQYIVEVTAYDVAGNQTTQTMQVTVNNGVPPEPTPTPTQLPFGVRLDVPERAYPGSIFYVKGYLENPGTPESDMPVVFLLDIHGMYWFWPSWTRFHPPEQPDIDWRVMDIPSGSSLIDVISPFYWPDTGADAMSGLWFYGAVLTQDMASVFGNMDMAEWSYGPDAF
ncbi:M23 family metallopeptidase [bacterium]|nr:M23 family metallopeptidase [candidate division CSSED10-310 bacterium]